MKTEYKKQGDKWLCKLNIEVQALGKSKKEAVYNAVQKFKKAHKSA